jgi:hypothetical protein
VSVSKLLSDGRKLRGGPCPCKQQLEKSGRYRPLTPFSSNLRFQAEVATQPKIIPRTNLARVQLKVRGCSIVEAAFWRFCRRSMGPVQFSMFFCHHPKGGVRDYGYVVYLQFSACFSQWCGALLKFCELRANNSMKIGAGSRRAETAVARIEQQHGS